MSWWGREAWGLPPAGATVKAPPSGRVRPRPLPADREAIARKILARIPAYVPEWSNRRAGDPGIALVRIFAEEFESVLARADRLPEKALAEYLRDAGVLPLPASPAQAMLAFEVSTGATESVLVPAGFQVGADPATGEGEMVVFETSRALYAAPAAIAELHLQEGSAFRRITPPAGADAKPFEPFGRRAEAGRALYVGLEGQAGARFRERLTIGVSVASPPGSPPPASAGGVTPIPIPAAPLLRWELLDGVRWVPLDTALDETGGLVRSGVVELALPRSWKPGRPGGIAGDAQLHWLRLRIVYGRFAERPSLRALLLNVATATAGRTVRDEALDPVFGGGGRRFRLSQLPVLASTLVVEVDEDGGPRRWTEVESLADSGPEDRVYVLDPTSGELVFGDGVNGAAVPQGFRNVRALVYRVGGGAAGAVGAEAITTQLSSAPFVTGVTNPLRASGGMDGEPLAATLLRGPQEIRARNRAVAVADYELMALKAQGAQVVRAHAVSGLHPAYPGLPVPGVVGVFIVPPDRGEGAPTPDEGSLSAVAKWLSSNVAPAGVEVVAAAPRYHKVRAEIGVLVDPVKDVGATVRNVILALNAWIDPIRGGEDGGGWPFGGPIRYAPLLRRLQTGVDGVRAITRLTLVVDGARVAACTDFATAPHALLWPIGHEVVPVDGSRA